jgi:hypothetical protein
MKAKLYSDELDYWSSCKITVLARFDHRLEWPGEAFLMIGQPHPFFTSKLCVKVEPVGGDEWTYKLYFE